MITIRINHVKYDIRLGIIEVACQIEDIVVNQGKTVSSHYFILVIYVLKI